MAVPFSLVVVFPSNLTDGGRAVPTLLGGLRAHLNASNALVRENAPDER
jgi:hypothetical protein